MLIDTHCHLQDLDFYSDAERAEILRSLPEFGVEKVICIGTDPEDSLVAKRFAEANEPVFWTFGVHPNEWTEATAAQIEALREEISGEKLVGVGEIGLDYHFEGFDRELQIRGFEYQLQLAMDLGLPVSFHIREAFDDFWGVVANFPKVRGVVHSFSDNKKQLRRILETTDFYVGVNGLATYSTLPTPPLERIILETDAPFLTPVPKRGKINSPAYVKYVADFLSTKLGASVDQIAEETTKNAKQLFGFKNCQR